MHFVNLTRLNQLVTVGVSKTGYGGEICQYDCLICVQVLDMGFAWGEIDSFTAGGVGNLEV